MPSREYHEALWQRIPQGLEPSDFTLRRRFLLERVQAGERVLDVGCGEGRFAAELARVGARVVGVDVAQEPLRRARERDPQLDLRLTPPLGEWELEDASFDAVWAGEVIEHVADTAAWLSEIRRVLRSGGSLLLSTPAHEPLALLRSRCQGARLPATSTRAVITCASLAARRSPSCSLISASRRSSWRLRADRRAHDDCCSPRRPAGVFEPATEAGRRARGAPGANARHRLDRRGHRP